MIATIKFSNWFKQNTPVLSQKIGDIGLIAAFVSGNLLMFKDTLVSIGLTSIANNPIFDKINVVMLAIGVTTKFLSKFFGEIQTDGLFKAMQESADSLHISKQYITSNIIDAKEAVPQALYNRLQSSTEVIEQVIKQLNLFDENHPAIKAALQNKELLQLIDNLKTTKP
jgi:predicted DNA-binding protein YlxM (UPF0122 family)